jgi:ketosteroid isomerase-like protein
VILAAMPATSSDILRRHFGAFESGGIDAVSEFWHPEIQWRAVEAAPDDVGVMRGREALRRYYQDWVDTLDDMHAEVDEVLLEEEDRVAVAVRNSGRGRVSGAPTTGCYYVACIVRDGQIVVGNEYATPAEAVAALPRMT